MCLLLRVLLKIKNKLVCIRTAQTILYINSFIKFKLVPTLTLTLTLTLHALTPTPPPASSSRYDLIVVALLTVFAALVYASTSPNEQYGGDREWVSKTRTYWLRALYGWLCAPWLLLKVEMAP